MNESMNYLSPGSSCSNHSSSRRTLSSSFQRPRAASALLYLVLTACAVAALPLPDAQYYDDYPPLPPPPGDPYGPLPDPFGPVYDPYGPRHDPYGPVVVDPYSYPPPPPHFDPYYDPYAPYPHPPPPPYPHHPPPPPPPNNQAWFLISPVHILVFEPSNHAEPVVYFHRGFLLFQDRKINREEDKKKKGGVLDFDGEDARKAAQSTRVVADVMDELADSGDTLDFLGKFIFALLTLHD